jgi:hypothetical protein
MVRMAVKYTECYYVKYGFTVHDTIYISRADCEYSI